MKIKFLCLSWLISIAIFSNAQKRAASYPFEFNKGFLARKNYDSYFLQDPLTKQFMLVLRDNQKADYILYDDKIKKVGNFSPSDGLKNTVFNFDEEEYLGGTAGNGKFHFVYKVSDKKFIGNNTYYQVETVDPAAKKVTNRQLFEIPKDEKLIISFGNFGQYFSITANNKSDELILYTMNGAGESNIKKVKVAIPETSNKKKLTDYLGDIKLITDTEGEEPGLESAIQKAKIFHSPEKLTIIINEDDDPTQIINIHTKDLSFDQIAIAHSSLIKEDKGKSYVSSFLKGDKLFTLALNKKDIKIAIYSIPDGSLLSHHLINSETDFNLFALTPIEEQRLGKKTKEKDIDDIKKLLKALTKGAEGLTVSMNKNGQYIVTVGTYDYIPVQTGETPGRLQRTSSVNMTQPSVSVIGGKTTTTNYVYSQTYIPGSPIYTSKLANFYKTTHFTLLIDDKSLKIGKGKVPISAVEQVKDYLSGVSKADAMNQFKINDKQYFSYYDRDDKMYYIEEIFIRK